MDTEKQPLWVTLINIAIYINWAVAGTAGVFVAAGSEYAKGVLLICLIIYLVQSALIHLFVGRKGPWVQKSREARLVEELEELARYTAAMEEAKKDKSKPAA